jgi:hypothetical protein
LQFFTKNIVEERLPGRYSVVHSESSLCQQYHPQCNVFVSTPTCFERVDRTHNAMCLCLQ